MNRSKGQLYQGERTEGCTEVDENKASGEPSEVPCRKRVLHDCGSTWGRCREIDTYKDAVKYKETGEESDYFPICDDKVTILCDPWAAVGTLAGAKRRTFATTTAAQIMLARPNSVDETPATWPCESEKSSWVNSQGRTARRTQDV